MSEDTERTGLPGVERTLPVYVCDACAVPHSECVRLGERPSLLYAGAHRRRIRQRETNLLRSEQGDKRNPSSSEGDGQRGGTEAGDGTTSVV